MVCRAGPHRREAKRSAKFGRWVSRDGADEDRTSRIDRRRRFLAIEDGGRLAALRGRLHARRDGEAGLDVDVLIRDAREDEVHSLPERGSSAAPDN